jgi:hypothetical protein
MRDHMLGFPPAMLALEDLPDTPKPRPHCPTPRRPRLTATGAGINRELDLRKTAALTVELERKIREEQAAMLAADPEAVKRFVHKKVVVGGVYEAAAPLPAEVAPCRQSSVVKALVDWAKSALIPGYINYWAFADPLIAEKLQLLRLLGVGPLEVWKGVWAGSSSRMSPGHALDMIRNGNVDTRQYQYSISVKHRGFAAPEEIQAFAQVIASRSYASHS